MTDNLQEEWLQDLAASIKLPSLSPSVCRTLFAVIEANLRQLIQKAWKYTRRSHSRTMKVEDFNLALLANKDQPIYGLTNPHADRQQNKDNLGPGYVNLIDFANTPLPPIPLKPQIHLHWLAVNGEQPMIAENPSISSKAAMGDDEFKTMSLPKEMQQLYQRITGILIASDNTQALDAVFKVFRTDAGLQELVPYFSRFFYQQIKTNPKRLALLSVIIKSIHELLENPNVSLDFHLNQLLPVIFTCVLAPKLSFNAAEDHWSLRRKTSKVIAMIVASYKFSYPDIHARVCMTYLKAMAPDNSLGTVYGGLVGLTALGQSVVEYSNGKGHSVVEYVLLPYLPELDKRLASHVTLPSPNALTAAGAGANDAAAAAAASTSGAMDVTLDDKVTPGTGAGSKRTIDGDRTRTSSSRKPARRKVVTSQLAIMMCRQALRDALGPYMVRCLRVPVVLDPKKRISNPKLSDLEEELVPYYVSASKDDYYCRLFI